MKSHHYISLALLGVLLVLLPLGQLQSQSLKRLKKELKVWVKLDGAWGLIDGNQQWIIEPNTNYEDCINMYDDMAIMELKNDSKDDLKSFQVINLSGDTLLEFKALQAQFFERAATIRIDTYSGYGCINLVGDTLVAPIYKRVNEDISDPTRFIISNTDRKYGLIDNQGKVLIPMVYKYIMTVYKDRYVARIKRSEEILISSKNEIITKKPYESLFHLTLLTGLNSATIFSEVYAIEDGGNYALSSIDGSKLYSLMNFIAFDGDLNWIPFQEGEKQGYKNRKAEILFSKKSNFIHLYPFSEKRAVFRKKNGDYSLEEGFGVIDLKGNEIIPPIYSFIHPYYNGLAACKRDKKYGMINRKGKVKIPFEYNSLSNSKYNKVIIVSKNERKGTINRRGNIVIPIIYKSISSFNKGRYIRASIESGKEGILDQKGREILPAIYDDIEYPEAPPKTIFKDFEED